MEGQTTRGDGAFLTSGGGEYSRRKKKAVEMLRRLLRRAAQPPPEAIHPLREKFLCGSRESYEVESKNPRTDYMSLLAGIVVLKTSLCGGDYHFIGAFATIAGPLFLSPLEPVCENGPRGEGCNEVCCII